MKYLPLMLLLACHPLWAKDILWMNNGDRLTGTIEEIGDESVRISLPYTGAVTVQRDAIKRWRLDKQDKPKATAKGGIKLFENENNERNAWLWTGSGDLSVKLLHKEKHTNNVNFKSKTELANLDWRYSVSGEYTYETLDSVTDSHNYKLNPTLDYFFNQQWFVRSSLNAEYDMLESNYLSLDFGTGPGYRFWNQKRRRLEFVAQGGLRKAYFRDNMLLEALYDGERIINYPIASIHWDYRQPMPFWQDKLELFSQGRYQVYLDQPSPYITLDREMNGSIGLRYYFNDHLRLSWSSEMTREEGEAQFLDQVQSLNKSELKHLLNLGASF